MTKSDTIITVHLSAEKVGGDTWLTDAQDTHAAVAACEAALKSKGFTIIASNTKRGKRRKEPADGYAKVLREETES